MRRSRTEGLSLTSLEGVCAAARCSSSPTTTASYAALRAAPSNRAAATAYASASIQPYLIAALAEDPEALGERPVVVVTADDVTARDLARDLEAYLAPRRVRHYPSRGTGYASHIAPPPHLVGPSHRGPRRADRRGRRRAARRRRQRRRPRRDRPGRVASPRGLLAAGGRGDRPAVRRRAPRGSRIRAHRSGRRARAVRASRRHPRRLRRHRGPRGPPRALRRRDRVDPLVLDLHAALAGRCVRARALACGRARLRAPAAGGGRPGRRRGRRGLRLVERCPSTRFRAPLDVIASRHGVRDRRRRGDRAGASRLTGRT